MANGFIHTELAVDNVDAAKKFYKKIFKWKMQDMGPSMGNYVMLDYGSKTTGGGITAKMMPNQPSAWMPYVEVTSVKKTIAAAQKAGAAVVVPFQSVGDMGALGIFVDPQGATLGVWEKAKKKAKKKATKKKATKKKATKKKATKKKATKKKAAKKATKKKAKKK